MSAKVAEDRLTSNKRRNIYLTDEILAGFDRYKYASQDTSPLAIHVLHPFWNWIVQFVPEWIAPNLLTLLGFLCVFTYYLLITCYDPYYKSEDELSAPFWVWLSAGILNFAAHTLDGIDGKQARKTGTGSPLGELFDHGLDSWTTGMFAASAYSLFGATGVYGLPRRAFFFVFLFVLFNFISAHWEKYNTGLFCLPWTYDLSLSVISLVYVATSICGVQLFHTAFPLPASVLSLLERVHVPQWVATHVLGKQCNTTYSCLSVAGHITAPETLALFVATSSFVGGFCVSALHVALKGTRGCVLEAARPLMPCFTLFALYAFWIGASPSNLVDYHPRVLFWALGTTFAQTTSRLIVAQMSGTRCPATQSCLVVLALCVVFCCFLLPRLEPATLGGLSLAQAELYVAIAYAVYITLAHIIYWFLVVYELRCHLRIRVFHIPHGAAKHKQH